MKKIMHAIINKITEVKEKVVQKTTELYIIFKCRSTAVLTQTSGEGFVDTALVRHVFN